MKHTKSLISLTVLVVASLACSVFVGGPAYPELPIPVSTDSVATFTQQMNDAKIASTQTGTLTLQINETQLTSYLAFKLQGQENPPFTDPQVFLRNGQMQIYGKIKQGMFTANMAIVLNVGIDESGKPKIEVASADFGPFPAPQGLNEAISKLVDETFTGSIGPAAIGLRIESIIIADGVMTLTGRIK